MPPSSSRRDCAGRRRGGLLQRAARGQQARAVAALTAACFTMLGVGPGSSRAAAAPGQGGPAATSQRGGGEGAPRRIGIFLLAANPDNRPNALALQTIFRKSARRLLGVRVVTGSPVPHAEQVDEAVDAARRAEAKLLDAAQGNADAARAAVEDYAHAMELLESAPGGADVRTLAWVAKGYGVAALLAGDRDTAHQMMRASLTLWPDQSPVEYAYNDDVRGYFEQVQREMAIEPTGRLAVTTTPPGAEVRVDGVQRGYAPIALTSTPAGTHWVEVALDGWYRAGRLVELAPAGDVKVALQLEPIPKAAELHAALERLARELPAESARGALEQLRGAVGADEILAALVSTAPERPFAVRGLYLAGGQLRPVVATFNKTGALLHDVQAFLSSLFGAESAPEVTPGPLSVPGRLGAQGQGAQGGEGALVNPEAALFQAQRRKHESITGKWWFWAAIAGGAAAVATAIALPIVLSKSSGGGGAKGTLRLDLQDFPQP